LSPARAFNIKGKTCAAIAINGFISLAPVAFGQLTSSHLDRSI
jgi:hypothetical protein